ncbi:hypothetical protein VC218_11405 [Xanthomonas nasturtii]|uniref:hypothetical protein n=1 Tax=Xanthomonas nasturtii TaxID=1843581 RepID=UPI002B222C1C|nr:hypothetical protein [Xanthomonas nasturtii]MEA9579493.1 hypothetical protein [Xanthomonas nasturtii]
MRALVVLCLASIVVLTGCTSIPLAAVLSFSSLSPHSLAQLDPAHVLVRVSVPVGFELNISATRLDLQLKASGTSKAAAMGLTAVAVSRTERSGGLFSPDVPVSTYLLRLTPEGCRQLHELQHFILASNATQFEFVLRVPFATVPDSAREATFWAELKLSQAEPFKPLIDGAKIKFTTEQDGG